MKRLLHSARPPGLVLAAIVVAVSLASPMDVSRAATSDLVTNGSFDVGVDGWPSFADVPLEWFAEDALGDPASGSARITNGDAYDEGWDVQRFQCIDVEGTGQQITLEAHVRVPAGQPRFDYTDIATSAWSEPGCEGSYLGEALGAFVDEPTDWTLLTDSGTLPQGAKSLVVGMRLRKTAPGAGEDPDEPVYAFFDGIRLLIETPDLTYRAVAPGIARD